MHLHDSGINILDLKNMYLVERERETSLSTGVLPGCRKWPGLTEAKDWECWKVSHTVGRNQCLEHHRHLPGFASGGSHTQSQSQQSNPGTLICVSRVKCAPLDFFGGEAFKLINDISQVFSFSDINCETYIFSTPVFELLKMIYFISLIYISIG